MAKNNIIWWIIGLIGFLIITGIIDLSNIFSVAVDGASGSGGSAGVSGGIGG